MTGVEGWRRKLTQHEAAEFSLEHGELVYQWNIEQTEFGAWRLG